MNFVTNVIFRELNYREFCIIKFIKKYNYETTGNTQTNG